MINEKESCYYSKQFLGLNENQLYLWGGGIEIDMKLTLSNHMRNDSK